MSRSKPFDLVQSIKSLWHSHPKNTGRTYGATGRDMKAAKDWLQVNEWESGDLSALSDRFNRYMDSDFEGWKTADYPIYGFLEFYHRYAPPRKSEAQQPVRASTRYCSLCNTTHSINVSCPQKRDILSLVSGINKSA